jgi:CheY-like chemotaxis protein
MQRILIVDDIFVNRLLLKDIIKNICSQCFEAQNGKDAIEILQKEKIDLVFMDIEMPVMNGLETTKYIRKNSPRSGLSIALTAHNPANFLKIFTGWFDYLMTKPYSIEKIAKAIEEVCPQKK